MITFGNWIFESFFLPVFEICKDFCENRIVPDWPIVVHFIPMDPLIPDSLEVDLIDSDVINWIIYLLNATGEKGDAGSMWAMLEN